MPHEIQQFEKLVHAFELKIIKTKKPDLSLFSNLNLWFSGCPARKKLIKDYLENLPQSHYQAFFPKNRLDEWHLKEPSLITLN
jgi:chlorite dismutase